MPGHPPYCKRCKAKGRDIRISNIHYNSDGTVSADFRCDFCARIWSREAPTLEALHASACSGYRDAVAHASRASTIISIVHR